jgi:hypothetical protein
VRLMILLISGLQSRNPKKLDEEERCSSRVEKTNPNILSTERNGTKSSPTTNWEFLFEMKLLCCLCFVDIKFHALLWACDGWPCSMHFKTTCTSH